mmetsp:Transcript_2495/g.5468  ORF Transcript_2495/g.5468 Transcript_2495/m.5468 type:complete len:590 (-) Transcript_2495:192-1961(-)
MGAVDAMRPGRPDAPPLGSIDPEVRWKTSTELPPSTRLPGLVFQQRGREVDAAGGGPRAAPGVANMEDPIFSTHSKMYLRRKEIEEELRREFNLPADDFAAGVVHPGARVRNGSSFGHPPPVPHPRPAPRNLPPVPKLSSPAQQNWPRWGVVDGQAGAAAAGAPPAKDSAEAAWWRQEQQELERRRNLRSTTPDVLLRGREPVREADPPARAGRSPSPGPELPQAGPPLPQVPVAPHGMQARERPYSWRSAQQPSTPRSNNNMLREEMNVIPTEPSAISAPSRRHESREQSRTDEASVVDSSQEKPHQRKAKELQEQARALKRERSERHANRAREEVAAEAKPPPPPQPPPPQPAPFQPHQAPPPNTHTFAASRRVEEDARRRILEEKARDLEEQDRERRRERMMAKMAEQEEARARQRRAAEEVNEELRKREEQKFEAMRQQELRRIQRQQEEAQKRRKEQEEWEEKFRQKLAEEQREMRGRNDGFRASYKRRSSGMGSSMKRNASVPAGLNQQNQVHQQNLKESMRHAEARAMQQLSALQRLPNKDAKHKAYKELLRAWHPDKNPSNTAIATAVFQRLQAERGRLGL